MNKMLRKLIVLVVPVLSSGAVLAATKDVSITGSYKGTTFFVFVAVVAMLLAASFLAVLKRKSAVGAGDVILSGNGFKNGLAVAGGYVSATAFFGIIGLISLYGYDGFEYALCLIVAYGLAVLLVTEPCRNIGESTLSGILSYRHDIKIIKIATASTTLIISIIYITAQLMMGAWMINALIGISYEIAISAIGGLIIVYAVFGGAKTTVLGQTVKMALLLVIALLLVGLVWAPYGFSLPAFLQEVVSNTIVQSNVAQKLGEAAVGMSALELGQRFFEPSLFMANPAEHVSIGMALIFGAAGMPHIFKHYYTAREDKVARKSVMWSVGIVAIFYMLTLFLGMGGAALLGANKIAASDVGGNLALPLLAQYLGGGEASFIGNMLLAIVAAIAFSTIVNVVANLVSASAEAVTNDIYADGIRDGEVRDTNRKLFAALACFIIGAITVGFGVFAKGQNVMILIALGFAIAASTNFPAIVLSLHWRKCSTSGIVAGIIMGTLSAIALMLVSPNMTYPNVVVAHANKVLDGEPAKPQQLARPAIGGYSFTCELFNDEDCQHAKPARRAAPARSAVPGTRGKLAMLEKKIEESTNLDEKKQLNLELAQIKKIHYQALRDLRHYKGKRLSIIGFEEPIFMLRNPAILSLPISLLFMVLFSFFTTDERAEDKWSELYVVQHTGHTPEDD